MKIILSSVVTGMLLLASAWCGSAAGTKVAAQSPVPSISFEEVLKAHGGREAIQQAVVFRARATRITPTLPPAFIERRVLVEAEGEKFRRHTVDPLGLRDQEESFDGVTGWYSVLDASNPESSGRSQRSSMNSVRVKEVDFQVRIFGLIPLLRQIAATNPESISQEPAPGLPERFRVKALDGDLVVSTDPGRRVHQIEVGDKTLQFADYRTVDGVQLPFFERVWSNSSLLYELVFSKIEFKPKVSVDPFGPTFSSSAPRP